ncbi:MAG: hypothetical protein RBQ88_07635 [Desulfobulbus oligotrophicus]|uniref:Lipoprotein n=1 Tax=Desulfobulbus oligotrophicus TaxID=1909699 RepID=A0A7T5VBY1_9BACT|nr:hypothetical protein [Desulfobulbus oligotrophicus]QQG65059.1 hypothetical protein HP555_03850 [Desulfobulbus oligotrophicus]
MKKIVMTGLLLTLLISLGACCRPGYWHGHGGAHSAGWHHHNNQNGHHPGWHKNGYGRRR